MANQKPKPMHSGFNSPTYLLVGGGASIVLGILQDDSTLLIFGSACALLAAFNHGQNTVPPK